jgi:hypothetical protein
MMDLWTKVRDKGPGQSTPHTRHHQAAQAIHGLPGQAVREWISKTGQNTEENTVKVMYILIAPIYQKIVPIRGDLQGISGPAPQYAFSN